MRWIEKPASADVLHPRVTLGAGRGWIEVDAFDELGAYVNGLDMKGIVAGPNQGREEVPLAQAGPGLYRGSFRAAEVGDYTLTISASAGPATLLRTIGVSRPWSEEYRISAADMRLLGRLAAGTGGMVISSADDGEALAALFARESVSGSSGSAAFGIPQAGAVWPWLLAAALLLFVLDIAARKLVLAPLARLAGRLAPRARPGSSYEEVAAMVTKAREDERRKLRDGVPAERVPPYGVTGMASEKKVDPDLAAYLYIARLRSRRSQGSAGEGSRGKGR